MVLLYGSISNTTGFSERPSFTRTVTSWRFLTNAQRFELRTFVRAYINHSRITRATSLKILGVTIIIIIIINFIRSWQHNWTIESDKVIKHKIAKLTATTATHMSGSISNNFCIKSVWKSNVNWSINLVISDLLWDRSQADTSRAHHAHGYCLS